MEEERYFAWDPNVPDEEKDIIKEKIDYEIKYNEGDAYDSLNEEFRSQVRVNGKVYAFKLDWTETETDECLFGSYIEVKRVR